ncbi:hypothetical protein HPB47_021534 [Ixodes persulcatus]|uniref:Uncharacterized protein n=1 Tax=Ixodes persulcatus TaxID=34615 RepID=A0AC60QCH5_IXOPE|nr:hypothetical protein HPB47_021534 [Ixodes persulcatus]
MERKNWERVFFPAEAADEYLERAEKILKAATPFQSLCIAQAEDISFDGNDVMMLDEPGTGTESSQAVSINEGLDLLDEPQPDGPHDEPLQQEPEGMPQEPEELEDVAEDISFDGNDVMMLDEPGTGTESSQAVSINEGLDLLDEPQPDGPHDEPLQQEPEGMPQEPEELEDVGVIDSLVPLTCLTAAPENITLGHGTPGRIRHSSPFPPADPAGGTHRGAARHQCRFCAYSSQIKHNVTMHERTHTGERPFVCEVCHRAFTQRIDLIYHLRTHTGEKPHKCSTCGKEFRKAGHLKGHLRVHTGERPYKCLTCGLEFSCSSNFTKHCQKHLGNAS